MAAHSLARGPSPVVVALGLALSACDHTARPPAAGASLILVSVDTLRADHLPCYGYRGLTTPAYDALARDSILFERAFSHYPLTLPSHASLFTGLLPPEHGVRNNKGYVLEPDQETLAERLKAAGYRTAGFVSSMVLRKETGIAQGFDAYDAPGDEGKRVFSQRRGETTAGLARQWLQGQDPRDRFFLFLHLFDPHTPYDPPPPFDRGYANSYDGEVAYSNAVLEGVLATLRERGLYDSSLVVLLSDHGEGLGDHVEQEHGLLLYREALQIPLLFKLPRRSRAAERSRTAAGLADVGTTLLALLGLPGRLGQGEDLLSARPPAADRAIYGETWFAREQYGWSELRSVISGDGHYIEAPKPELYDWARDPGERHNLFPRVAVPPLFTRTIAGLGRGRAVTAQVTREDEERLAALGYVGGPARPETTPGTGADPKDHVALVVELWAEMDKIGKQDSVAPETRVKQLLAELGLRSEYLSRTIAYNILRAGRPATALEVLQPFAPAGEVETQVTMGEILMEMGRPRKAQDAFARALAQDPENAHAQRGLGIVALSAGRAREAREWLERSLARNPAMADAWNALGVARAQSGDFPGSVQAWRKTVELDPGAALAWFNLGVALEKAGDRSGAVAALERYLPLVQGAPHADAEARLRRLRSGA